MIRAKRLAHFQKILNHLLYSISKVQIFRASEPPTKDSNFGMLFSLHTMRLSKNPKPGITNRVQENRHFKELLEKCSLFPSNRRALLNFYLMITVSLSIFRNFE